MKKALWDLESNRFSLAEWEKTRIEYWQPVLYFNGPNKQKIDFNICAKNACTTIKTYFGWAHDRDWLTKNKFSELDLEEFKLDPTISDTDLENLKSGQMVLTPLNTRRKTRIGLWHNSDDTGWEFFRYDVPRFAIKRDPIKRFISGYYQIHNDNAWLIFKSHSYNIDEMLDHLENNTFWNEHLSSQTWWMSGRSTDDFDYIYDISHTNECMDHMQRLMGFKSEVPDIHMMKTKKLDPPELTSLQKNRIEELYKEDYYNGWY